MYVTWLFSTKIIGLAVDCLRSSASALDADDDEHAVCSAGILDDILSIISLTSSVADVLAVAALLVLDIDDIMPRFFSQILSQSLDSSILTSSRNRRCMTVVVSLWEDNVHVLYIFIALIQLSGLNTFN